MYLHGVATVELLPTVERRTAPAVRTCYDLMTVAPVCGVTDLTDGKYLDDRNDRAAYLAAQERQAEYLLDQAQCGAETRLLDIGCGYGRILEQAVRRGASATGITVSPPQVANGRSRGLDVRELNYRHIFNRGDDSWQHAFDAIVANGSLEHFVQAADAAAGRADAMYEEMFAICRRLLADSGRFVTTAIHFRDAEQFDPHQIALGAADQPRRAARISSRCSPSGLAAGIPSRGSWPGAPGHTSNSSKKKTARTTIILRASTGWRGSSARWLSTRVCGGQ